MVPRNSVSLGNRQLPQQQAFNVTLLYYTTRVPRQATPRFCSLFQSLFMFIFLPSTSMDVVPNIPKCPIPVLIYRNNRSVRYGHESLYRYRYPCRTELTEVSGIGIDVIPNLPKCPVPVIPAVCFCRYRTEHMLEYCYMLYYHHLFVVVLLLLQSSYIRKRAVRRLLPYTRYTATTTV